MRSLTRAQVQATFQATLLRSSSLTRQCHKLGYKMRFFRQPKLTRPSCQPSGAVGDEKLLHEKFQDLVRRGIARIVRDNSPGYYSKSFLIPKKRRGEWRLISDLRNLNTHVIHQKTKLRSLSSALQSVHHKTFMTSADVEDGYFNVRVHPSHTKYLRFKIGATTYELLRLPMGFVESSVAFSAWLLPYVTTIQQLFPSVSVFAYSDDMLFVLPRSTRTRALHLAHQLQAALMALKLPLKAEKSSWVPTRKLEYLGFIIDSRAMSICVPTKKSKMISKQIRKCLRKAEAQRLRLSVLSSTIGQLIALLPAVPEGRLHAAELYRTQNEIVQIHGWQSHKTVQLTFATRSELHWWLQYLSIRRFRKISNAFTHHELTIMATDASDHTIAGTLISDDNMPYWYRSLSRKEQRQRINLKELLAVWESIQHFHDQVRSSHLNVRCDSTTVVAALNKWGSRDRTLHPLLDVIFQWCLQYDTTITATYIASHSNSVADGLTREDHPPTRAAAAEMKLLHHGIRSQNARLSWVFSREAIHTAKRICRATHVSTDINAIASTRTHTLLIPQVWQIPATLDLIESSRRQVTLLVPLWPSAAWFNRVARLCARTPFLLGATAARPVNQRVKSKPSWGWLGVTVSPRKSVRTKFRRKLSSTADSPCNHKGCTIWAGGSSARILDRFQTYIGRFIQTALKSKY